MKKRAVSWTILIEILKEATLIDFHDQLKLDPKDKISDKHRIVGIVKDLIDRAKAKKTNLLIYNDTVYIFNGTFWEKFSRENLKLFLRYYAKKCGCRESSSRYYEFLDKLMKQFFTDAHFPFRDPVANKISINLTNGTYDFVGGIGNFRMFDSLDFHRYQLPFGYDASASCPMFDAFLLKVLPDMEGRAVLQEYAGYIFSGQNLEKMLMMLGGGANGKSVFFNVLCALLGETNILTFSMALFNSEYNRAKLENVWLNYSSERGTELNPDLFKALVSSEPVHAREPYGKPFVLKNKARFIVNANSLPKETEQTAAFFRRWIILPFDVTIPEEERDPELANKIIQNELPGVFNWLLVGLERITKNGKFTLSAKSIAAVEDFRHKSDNVSLFLEDSLLIKSSNKKISLKKLYIDYRTFCEMDGYKRLGKQKFTERVEAKGFEKVRLSDGSTGFLMEKQVEVEEIRTSEVQTNSIEIMTLFGDI